MDIMIIITLIATTINDLGDSARYGLMDSMPMLFDFLDLFFHVYEDGTME